MEAMGLQGNILQWVKQFVFKRTYQVRVNHNLSDTEVKETGRGLPQGSVISPILFNSYINDIVQECKNSNIALFADDVALWNNNKDLNLLQNQLQEDLTRVEQ